MEAAGAEVQPVAAAAASAAGAAEPGLGNGSEEQLYASAAEIHQWMAGVMEAASLEAQPAAAAATAAIGAMSS